MIVKQYIVYDLKGNEVARGTRKELREQNIVKGTISLDVYADTNVVLLKKYKVKSNGKVEIVSATKQKSLDRPRLRTVYSIIDSATDEVVFTGTLSQAEKSEKWSKYRNKLSMYAYHRHRLEGKYYVKVVGSWSAKENKILPYHPPRPQKIRIEKAKPLTELEYLVMHLRMYGNTFTRADPSQYTNDLKDRGIEIDVQTFKDSKGIGYLINRV